MTTIACSCSCSPDSLFYGMCEFTGCPFGGHSITEETRISDKDNVYNGSHFGSMLEEDLIPAPKRFKFSDESQMRKLAEVYSPRPLSKCLNNGVKIGILVDVEPFLQPYLQQKMFLCYQNTYHSL